jgi:hypothetical protein
MPLDLRAKFSKTAEVTFDVDERNSLHKIAFKSSFRQIVRATFDVWTETLQQAKSLSRELDEDNEIKRYSKCLSQCSKNYREWLVDDYKLK